MKKTKVKSYKRNGKRVRSHMRVSKSCVGKPLNKPFKSNRQFKKRQVCVKNEKGNIVSVHYGDNRYEDFTQHKNPERRRNFRKRHRCDPVSKLKKTKPRYWACQDLW
jgi:hypothetical protein